WCGGPRPARPEEQSMANTVEVKVPDIGGYEDVPVIEVLVAVGDMVSKDQGLVTLESDKATMEVPSSHAGVVKELKVKVGDTVSEGSVVVVLEAEGAGSPHAAAGQADAGGASSPQPARPVGAADGRSSARGSMSHERAASPPAGGAGGAAAGGGVVEAGRGSGVRVAAGDAVAEDQGLVALESDEAAMEVPSSHAGGVKGLKVQVGDTLSEGSVVALIEAEGAASAGPVPASQKVAPG